MQQLEHGEHGAGVDDRTDQCRGESRSGLPRRRVAHRSRRGRAGRPCAVLAGVDLADAHDEVGEGDGVGDKRRPTVVAAHVIVEEEERKEKEGMMRNLKEGEKVRE